MGAACVQHRKCRNRNPPSLLLRSHLGCKTYGRRITAAGTRGSIAECPRAVSIALGMAHTALQVDAPSAAA